MCPPHQHKFFVPQRPSLFPLHSICFPFPQVKRLIQVSKDTPVKRQWNTGSSFEEQRGIINAASHKDV
jgi:hypothetical protein